MKLQKLKRFGVVFALVMSALLAVPVPAQADDYDDFQYCLWEYENMHFAYDAGSFDVYAGRWVDYGLEQQNKPNNPCHDINVEITNTGGFVVRTQICPHPNGPSFSCYSMGWGSLNQFTTYGVSVHSYHLPCGGACTFYFRVETTTSETLRMIY
jgi:hypothetical protein